MNTVPVVGSGCSTEGGNTIRVERLSAAVHQRVVRSLVRVGMSGGVGACISSRVASAVRIGHAAAESGGSLAVGAGLGVAPSSVPARVLGHLSTTYGRECWIMVGVETILLHLFPTLVLVVLPLLSLPPK